MSELTIRGIYFKNYSGNWVESHTGTPGVELTIGGLSVFIDSREVSILAKSIGHLGTSGKNSVTIRTCPPAPAVRR